MNVESNPSSSFAREYFRRTLRAGRLSHAYLLVGPEEAEKERFAIELAKMLFCGSEDPCGVCAACRSIEHGNHAGVSVYGPVDGKKVIDIETIRAICDRSHYSRDHVFVAIIEGAHRMTVPAANALLKTLEEPVGDFLLVLTTTSSGSLLPTIVSRCHRILFSPSSSQTTADGLDCSAALLERLDRDFFAREDPRRLLAEIDPDGENNRARVRRLIDECVRRNRMAMRESGKSGLDQLLDDQGLFLELRGALDGNVAPDLVLEQLLSRLWRRHARR